MNTAAHPTIKSMSPLLLVADLDRAIGFYTQYLGFGINFRYEDFYAGVVKDGCSIHLKLGSPVKAERESRRKNEDLDLVFSVENLGALYQAVQNMPVVIVQPLREMPYGTEFYIVDPDGYLISFLTENTDPI